jgi:hypothetical protein
VNVPSSRISKVTFMRCSCSSGVDVPFHVPTSEFNDGNPHYGNQRGHSGWPCEGRRLEADTFFEDGHEEPYNLKEDIGETENLAETEPEKRA